MYFVFGETLYLWAGAEDENFGGSDPKSENSGYKIAEWNYMISVKSEGR